MVEVVRGFVKRSLDPVREHIRGLSKGRQALSEN